MPKLTIGMAHHADVARLESTVQSLRLHHAVDWNFEIVIVDNSANLPCTQDLVNFINSATSHDRCVIKYVPMTDPVGTSPTRDLIFQIATGDFVLVMDCHVMLDKDAISRLLKFYSEHPKTDDLYSGPLLTNDLRTSWTHFNDQWRAEMWGTWSTAWICPCGGTRFSTLDMGTGKMIPIALTMGAVKIDGCHYCGKQLPKDGPWNGHEDYLERQGWIPLGRDPDEKPFEIPGQGLGLFTCRRESWLGFNKDSRFFGGEELYIHQKYRKAGRTCWCLPFLRWWHDFYKDPNKPTYTNTTWNKCRNYVLESQELGEEWMPLLDVKNHFIGQNNFTEAHWNKLIADPVKRVNESDCPGCQAAQAAMMIQDDPQIKTLDDAFDVVSKIPRDMEQHMPKLRELAADVSHVTEISHRREGTIAFLAARPKFIKSYNLEPASPQLSKLAKEAGVSLDIQAPADGYVKIEPTDLLFIDDVETYERTKQHLERLSGSVSRYIVFHDTIFAPPMMQAIREFLFVNRQWSVIYHTVEEHGLTVLGCRDEDKPKLPPFTDELKNVTRSIWKAATNYVKGGQTNVEPEVYEKRLSICATCTQRVNDRCAACGCRIELKASLATDTCPLLYWPLLNAEGKVE